MKLRSCLPLCLALLLAIPTGASSRVVAIGDVHGAHREFLDLLEKAELIDADGRWVGGSDVLVQTGDLVDRGLDVRAVLELLIDLQRQASAAGGEVVVLLGNHEAMNLVREMRDFNPEAYAAFADEKSESRRRQAYAEWQDFQRQRARRADLGRPRFSREVREGWMAAHPPGMLEYLEALSEDGRLGAWLRQRPAVARIGDSIFLHGGISPDTADIPLESLNRKVREEIAAFDGIRRRLLEADPPVILSWFTRGETIAVLQEEIRFDLAGDPPRDPERAERLTETLNEIERLSVSSLSFGAEGPLWFRGYTRWPDEVLQPFLEGYLGRQVARRIVVAHTPSVRGRIESRLDGKVFLIDTGMLSSVYNGGRPSALEIVDSSVAEIYAEEDPEPIPAAPHDAAAAPGGAPLLRLAALLAASPQPAVHAPPKRILLGRDKQPLPFETEEELLDFLRHAEITSSRELGVGITKPLLLELERDGVAARAVYHDVDVQKRNVRLHSRGIVGDFRDSYRGQVAAYRIARILGLDRVPPAVEREVNGTRGSVALWIEDAMMDQERTQQGIVHPDPIAFTREFYDLRVFDNLVNNIDRNQTNILFDGVWNTWWIDCTRCFGRTGKLPNPERIVRCSRTLFGALKGLDESRVGEAVRGLLWAPEVKALIKRRDRIVEVIEGKIAIVGEEHVLFDHGAPRDDIRIIEDSMPEP